ncbi:hemerythrin domain-containing protein [Streptomyces sp. NPDC008313]|uniref:hemerythrin domain-containing protein n=1 Tax=Streptomyces sp. NPDC008313 TaxID=3364826 RepID=UPI0036E01896
MAHGADVIQELTSDHREVQALFDRFRAAAPGSAERADLVDRLTIELVRHSVAEKEYLYPAVRDHVADGDRWADKELAEHQEVEELLRDLAGREADAEDFDELVLSLVVQVTAHAREEEQLLFPRLQAVCPAGILDELGEKVRQAKRTAPTRARPRLPDSPLVNKALAPRVGLLDRLRDVLTRRGRG